MRRCSGAKRAIVHVYNSTSTLQRRVVFNQDMAGHQGDRVNGAKLVRELAEKQTGNTEFVYQYSPESFTGTEIDYCDRGVRGGDGCVEPTPSNKCILNLPATVEMSTPEHLRRSDRVFLPQAEEPRQRDHQPAIRTTTAAPASPRRVGVIGGAPTHRGTLLRQRRAHRQTSISSPGLEPASPRRRSEDRFLRHQRSRAHRRILHPAAGASASLRTRATSSSPPFSGSHQDAIKKGFAAMKQSNSGEWAVPYLPIDPQDVGRDYEAVIRINSQSGKGGVAYILEKDHGITLPGSSRSSSARSSRRSPTRPARRFPAT
jgi:2-isopropylmalate synthase